MIERLKQFIKGEEGTTLEYLVKVIIIGLGSAAILFGILTALRQRGGEIIERINEVNF